MSSIRKKRIWIIGAVVIIILLVLWSIRVISLNRYYQETDAVPEINAGIGEYVSFGMNYSYGEWPNGYSIRADDYQIMDTDDYLEQHHARKEDYPYCHEKVCIVDVTVRYDTPDETSDRDTEGLYLGNIWLYGTDHYEGQNSDFFDLENPQMEGSQGVILKDGEEYHVRLVYDLIQRDFTKKNWEHLDKIDLKLYLTGYPEQKNIVLQE